MSKVLGVTTNLTFTPNSTNAAKFINAFAVLEDFYAPDVLSLLILNHFQSLTMVQCWYNYPSSYNITFANLAVKVNGQPVVPTWTPLGRGPSINLCKEQATIISPSQVKITWN